MARGARGEYTIHENKARGRFEVRVTETDPRTGRTTRRYLTAKTRQGVREKLKDFQRAQDEGRTVDSGKATVADWAAVWLDELLPGTVAPGTLTNYRDVLRLYVLPHVGSKTLEKLTPADVSRMLRTLADEGKSPNTQRLARSSLVRLLKRAEQEGMVGRNVAAIADGVKVGTPEGRYLTTEQARTLLDSVADDRMEAAYVVGLTLGLRRGELLGLAWSDLDLDGDSPTLRVQRQLVRVDGEGLVLAEPKTKQSRRTVTLNQRAVDALRRHRQRMRDEAEVVGPDWPTEPLGADLIFRSPLGNPFDPDNLTRLFSTTTKRVLGESWSPHTLRHSAASFLFAEGLDLKSAQTVLGHSSIRITADVYTHLLDEAGSAAADAMTRALG